MNNGRNQKTSLLVTRVRENLNSVLKAASLLETVVVLAIFTLLVFVTFPFSLTILNQSKGDSEAKEITFEIFRQQQEAYSGNLNKPYGVAFYDDHLVSFRGNSLATAEATDSIPISAPIRINNIAIGGGNEIVFQPGSFRPSFSGHIDVTDTSKSYRITITSEGMLTYSKL